MNEDTLRIEARFKNARLYNAIAEAYVPLSVHHERVRAIGPVHSFCELHKLTYKSVMDLLNLRISPIVYHDSRAKQKPKVRPVCQRLADLLNCEVGWLFPTHLYSVTWPRVAVEMPVERMLPLLAAPKDVLALPPTQETLMVAEELRATIHAKLDTLRPREARIMRQRFGLDGGHEWTLREVAETEGVTPQRIREIEASAIRKMRHPSRSRALREFLEPAH